MVSTDGGSRACPVLMFFGHDQSGDEHDCTYSTFGYDRRADPRGVTGDGPGPEVMVASTAVATRTIRSSDRPQECWKQSTGESRCF
ncbi:hypothetical protein F4827_003884 [Paraburkholderia bannensis]|jgi:hypothetical protein|uniref:Uncharacterized protein n=1 Tax=Paraburkholderia bannensis TaxID=765414 RepID=A0A7W9WSA3_9BURK|nr:MULTISPECIES: hypothetical protein [Paraburkholderia]MBB3259010.1 hypothetical protein [Paraburkholderia sp. WP4_3_2]MBB6104025.1 hypothetical protein [Paraburkholderia bannensis]